jgi:hypothetical protein
LITATAIITVALEGTNSVVPFYRAIYGESKQLLVNYTFGTAMGYESVMGSLKEKLFDCIEWGGVTTIKFLEGRDAERIKEEMLAILEEAAPDSKLLFIYSRSLGDDVPFFEAVGLKTANGELVMRKPISLSDLGIKIKPPFREIKF